MTLMVPVQPEEAEAIFAGRLTYIFRSTKPQNREGNDRLLLYIPCPAKSIVGEVRIISTLSRYPDAEIIWHAVKDKVDITEEEFYRFSGLARRSGPVTKRVIAIKIGYPTRYDEPKPVEYSGGPWGRYTEGIA